MTKDFIRKYFLFFILLLTAFFLRFFALENIPGFLGDEAWGFAQTNSLLKGLPYHFNVPSGRILNPIYTAILLLFHTSDPFYMRLISVLIGTGAIALAWVQMRKIYGNFIAAGASLITASFSIHILYSRLAWDCCLILPISVLLTAFILKRQTLFFLIALAVGFSVHPTFIFFVVPASLIYIFDLREANVKIPWKIIVPTVVAGLTTITFYIIDKELTFRSFGIVEIIRVILGLVDYMTGTIISQELHDQRMSYMIPFLVLLIVLAWLSRKKFSLTEKLFFGGILLSFIGLFLIQGIWPIIPGHERLILYSGFPLCLFITLVACRSLANGYVLFLIAFFYQFITVQFLFDPIVTSRTPNLQFKSGPVEPKYAAIDWILKNNHSEEITIIAEEWGIYWNVYNYALGNFPGKINMLQVSGQVGFDASESVDTPEKLEALMNKGTYAVGLRGGLINQLVFHSTENGNRYSRIGFKEFSGEDYIYVWVREDEN